MIIRCDYCEAPTTPENPVETIAGIIYHCATRERCLEAADEDVRDFDDERTP